MTLTNLVGQMNTVIAVMLSAYSNAMPSALYKTILRQIIRISLPHPDFYRGAKVYSQFGLQLYTQTVGSQGMNYMSTFNLVGKISLQLIFYIIRTIFLELKV